MKKIFLALMAVAAIAFTSCGKKATVELVSGSWVVTEVTWDVQGNDTSTLYVDMITNDLGRYKQMLVGNFGFVLSEDGKAATSDGFTGTWELSGNTISMTTYGFDGSANTIKINYKDGELVWEDDRLAGKRTQDLNEYYGITTYVVTHVLNKGQFTIDK